MKGVSPNPTSHNITPPSYYGLIAGLLLHRDVEKQYIQIATLLWLVT